MNVYATSAIIIDEDIIKNIVKIRAIVDSLNCELRDSSTYEKDAEGYELFSCIVKIPNLVIFDKFFQNASTRTGFKTWHYVSENKFFDAYDLDKDIESNPLRVTNWIDMLMEVAYFNTKLREKLNSSNK